MKFIIERRYYLERFLRKCTKYEYLLNSEEFLLFSRPNGDIEKMLAKINKIPTQTIIERVRTVTDINEKRYDISDKESYKNSLVEFTVFSKKVTAQMKQIKDLVEKSRSVKRMALNHTKAFLTLIDKYEEYNMKTYVEGVDSKLVFWKESNNELKS